jgi:acyl-CoA synthetase (AMP-forming)/AMP-acid ligase II
MKIAEEDADRTLESVFRRFRNDPAIVSLPGGQAITYGDVRRLSAGLATFVAGGSRPSRVALFVRSPYHFTQLYLAAFRLGLALVPLNPAMPRPNVARILRAARADLLVTDQPEVATESGMPSGRRRRTAAASFSTPRVPQARRRKRSRSAGRRC